MTKLKLIKLKWKMMNLENEFCIFEKKKCKKVKKVNIVVSGSRWGPILTRGQQHLWVRAGAENVTKNFINDIYFIIETYAPCLLGKLKR